MQDYDKYLTNLPVIPEVASKIMSIAEDKIDISFKALESIIKVDPGISSKILKVANSAMYSRQNEIKNLSMAITLLGFKNIKSLVLLVTASSSFAKYKKNPFYQYFWKHSIYTAFLAKHIAEKTGSKNDAETAFTVALLHDIGQVALFNYNPEEYGTIFADKVAENKATSSMEEISFGINHKEIGNVVLKKWNFPQVFVDAALEHGSLNITSKYKRIIIIITLADILSMRILGYQKPGEKSEVLRNAMIFLGLKKSDVEYYFTDYPEKLGQDPLFQECNDLFHLKAS